VHWSFVPGGVPVLPDRTPAGGVVRRPVPADGVPARRRPVRVARPVPAGACAGDDRVAGGADVRAWGRWRPGAEPAPERLPHPASRTSRPCLRPRAPARAASASSGGRWSSGGTCVRQTRWAVGRNPQRAGIHPMIASNLAPDRGIRRLRAASDLADPRAAGPPDDGPRRPHGWGRTTARGAPMGGGGRRPVLPGRFGRDEDRGARRLSPDRRPRRPPT
jgi:hypothetical protein